VAAQIEGLDAISDWIDLVVPVDVVVNRRVVFSKEGVLPRSGPV
jgi:hypothetical protein